MSGWDEREARIAGARLTYRIAGPADGPVALLVHGHTQTSAMWGPVAEALSADGWRVVAPDLHVRDREGPHSKADLAEAFDALLADVARPAAVTVGHDLGAMVAVAHAARNRDTLRALVIMEATPPGVGMWPQVLADPRAWHFHATGPHMERLIAGREDVWLDRFWTEFSGRGRSPMPEGARDAYVAAMRAPGAVRAALDHFAIFPTDAEAAPALEAGPLPMPVFAMGGALSFGPMIAEQLRLIASDVTEHVVPDSGHWLLEENGADTLAALRAFLAPHLATTVA